MHELHRLLVFTGAASSRGWPPGAFFGLMTPDLLKPFLGLFDLSQGHHYLTLQRESIGAWRVHGLRGNGTAGDLRLGRYTFFFSVSGKQEKLQQNSGELGTPSVTNGRSFWRIGRIMCRVKYVELQELRLW